MMNSLEYQHLVPGSSHDKHLCMSNPYNLYVLIVNDCYGIFDVQVLGLSTNIQFLTDLAKHPEFAKGNVHTDFIPQYQKDLFPERFTSNSAICQAVMALVLKQQDKIKQHVANTLGM